MWLGGVQPGDLPGTTVTRGDRCCAQGLQAVGLTRSREAAKGNAVVGFRCSVRRAADGSPRVRRRLRCSAVPGVGLWQCVGECVAPSPPTPLPRFTGARRALRSSGFPARDLLSATGCLQVAAAGRGGSSWAHAKPRSRERKRRGWFLVFGQASRGREAAGGQRLRCISVPGLVCGSVLGSVCAPSPPTPLPRFTGARRALRSSGFPARDLPSATGCLQVAAAGRGGSGWAHAKPRSRERKRSSWFSVFGQASRGRESAGEAAVALHCRAGVGLWQCVGECVAPSPPTPLPRFTGARGAVWVSRGGLRRRSGSSCRA